MTSATLTRPRGSVRLVGSEERIPFAVRPSRPVARRRVLAGGDLITLGALLHEVLGERLDELTGSGPLHP